MPGHPDWYTALPEAELLPLAPLEDSAAERLLQAYLGFSEVDEGVRVALLDRAQGNPFFLAELLHLLVDRGILVRDGSHWVLDGEVPEDILPAGVQAVLEVRGRGHAESVMARRRRLTWRLNGGRANWCAS